MVEASLVLPYLLLILDGIVLTMFCYYRTFTTLSSDISDLLFLRNLQSLSYLLKLDKFDTPEWSCVSSRTWPTSLHTLRNHVRRLSTRERCMVDRREARKRYK